ncbi:MAG: MATE family efflux transporter [Acidobacteria bacterium]|jgi:MATE family multidrug resistance protein|nr:MATE family efflux transporter [Acidobacteriota bacterium]MDP6687248.1 MATE family efflux transporter [Acidobacteriota bacterium]MEE3273362.1 MATE family efflux transporter [Acidobacteriota bacterium]
MSERLTQSLRQRYLRLAAINIMATVSVPLAGLVDTAILGHLEDIRFLAGVALGSIVFDYVYWTFGFLRMGTTGTTAQAMGGGNMKAVYLTLYRGLFLALSIGTALVVLQVPIRIGGFAVLSGAEGVEAAGVAYFNARVWGAPATLCSFVLIGWFLGREESGRVLLITVAANVSNILLDYVFVLGLGLAAFGAGLATMISQYLAVAIGLFLFWKSRESRPWVWGEILDRHGLTSLMRLNRDILFRTLGLITALSLFTNFSSVLGTTVLAANAILLRVQYLASYFIDGAAFATESLAGTFRGRGDPKGLLKLLRLSLVVGFACALGFAVLVVIAPGFLYPLLTSHQEVVEVATRFGYWLIPVLLFGSAAYIYDGFFLGLTEGRVLRNSMLFSTIVIFGSVAWVAVVRGDNHILWLSMTLWMASRAVTLSWASRSLLREAQRTWEPR